MTGFRFVADLQAAYRLSDLCRVASVLRSSLYAWRSRPQSARATANANLDRAGARLIDLVSPEQRRFMTKPSYEEVVSLEEFDPPRATDKGISDDRLGLFSRSMAYEGWTRSLFPVESLGLLSSRRR